MTAPTWYKRPLLGGESGPDVAVLNRKLGIPGDVYSDPSQQYVRGIEQTSGLPITGTVGEEVAALLGEAADAHLLPEWFTRPLGLGDRGEDVRALRERLDISTADLFDLDCARAVRRLQSAHAMELTGEVDETLSLLLP